MKLLAATTNAGKTREIQAVLGDLPLEAVLTLSALDREVPVWPEEGFTFAENAVGKALHYSSFCSHLTLAEDSGLEIQYLEGGPGIYSARFGGEHISYEEKNRMLLRLMENVPAEARRCRFHCVMALARGGALLATFDGAVEGEVAREIRGAEGFGYDPIFYYPPLGKTFGEIGMEQKNALSHRGKALAKLRQYLTSCLAALSQRAPAAP